MDQCCTMRGYLNFLVLRLISKGEMSGEDLRKELEKRKGTKPSAGTIYPVLKTLLDKGLIEEKKDSGKEKKYLLTKHGKKEIELETRKFIAVFYDMKEDFRKC